MPGELITLVEAAARLGISYNRMLRLVLIGDVAGERRDGRWFADASDVERRENARVTEAAPTDRGGR